MRGSAFPQKTGIVQYPIPTRCAFPQKFIVLLKTITIPKNQSTIIGMGIDGLFIQKCTEYIDPLLDALSDKTLSLQFLKPFTIQSIFIAAAAYHDEIMIERFYDNFFTTPMTCADGLIESGKDNVQDSTFKRLLEEADQGDLQALQAHDDYTEQGDDFHDAINRALSVAKSEGARCKGPFERARLVMQTFDGTPTLGIPRDIAHLINSYIFDRPGVTPKAILAKGIIDEILDTDKAAKRIGELVVLYLVDDDMEDDEWTLLPTFCRLYNPKPV